MPRLLLGLNKLLEHLLVLGMSVMSVMVFANVVLRYGFNSGISVSVELSRIIFVWIVFLGSVVALARGLHMGVDSLVRALPGPFRIVCFLVSQLLMLWCCWLLWQGSWIQTQLNWGNLSPISGVSTGVMYAAGLVASAFMALIIIANLWRSRSGSLPAGWGCDGEEKQ